MELAKPQTIEDYCKWLKKVHKVSLTREKKYYEVTSRTLLDKCTNSPFWQALLRTLPEIDVRYYQTRGAPLLTSGGSTPKLLTKPFNSMIDKSFRKNCVTNDRWPDPPSDGWVLPANWLTSVNDVVRTTLVVKYLDGATFLAEELDRLGRSNGLLCHADFEAREEGYYAVHVYVTLQGEIPTPTWKTQIIPFTIELQVATQLQDVIRTLTHHFYMGRRSKCAPPGRKWQWEYDTIEFRANYLAHALHLIDALVMEVRIEGGERHGT